MTDSKPESALPRVPVVKHFEDDDADLRGLVAQGHDPRNAPLRKGQEKSARDTAAELIQHIENSDPRVTWLIASPKLRTVQTAFLIAAQIRHLKPDLKVRVTADENLRELDLGSVILPSDYVPGKKFEGYQKAEKIFRAESEGSEGKPANIDYRFGDPIQLSEGVFMYPELVQYFEKGKYGESYREQLIRYCTAVLDFYANQERFGQHIRPVTITHGQTHRIFSVLADIAEQVRKGNALPEPGQLPAIFWERYKDRRKFPFGAVDNISTEGLNDSRVLDLLKRELDYLKAGA